ncbi:MAG: hypothetical protein P4L53_26530 [Candidatus Obscuribacterales bacterium]|nr:hypothetical protein [Candidatus Obscuribacterales bacterium]
MIKRSVIKNTAHCWWSADDECYLVQSPLFAVAIGTGETVLAAWLDYDSVLDQFYEELTHGTVGGYDSKGRPAKGGVNLHCQVQPETKEALNKLVADIGCSQGELVDWMTFVLTHQDKPQNCKTQSTLESLLENSWQTQVHEAAGGTHQRQTSAEQQIAMIKAFLLNDRSAQDGYTVRRTKPVSSIRKKTQRKK